MRVTRSIFILIICIPITICIHGCREKDIIKGKSGRTFFIMGNDNTPMARIAGGEFVMGNSSGPFGDQPVDENEFPTHKVYLETFYIDIYEVTNDQYKKFVEATSHRKPKYWDPIWADKYSGPERPVVGVSWDDAVEYATWAGKRLPTEAEWEKAARGGLVGKHFPWGDGITRNNANLGGTEYNSKDIYPETSPVGIFGSNNYGLHDMAGNVKEWCADWYSSDYYKRSPRENPKGPDSGYLRVWRGGGWEDIPYLLRVSYRGRDYPSATEWDIGFRCVIDVNR